MVATVFVILRLKARGFSYYNERFYVWRIWILYPRRKNVYGRFEVVNALADLKPRWNLRPGQQRESEGWSQ